VRIKDVVFSALTAAPLNQNVDVEELKGKI